MKKLTRIAALAAVTALLSACATPVDQSQGLRDVVEEKVQVVLADRAVKALENNLTEFGKEFAALKDKGLVLDDLENPFGDLKNEVGDIKNVPDPVARLNKAEELNQKLAALEARLEDRSEADVYYYRELEYTFSNVDAVASAEDSRRKYINRLKKMFSDNKEIMRYTPHCVEYEHEKKIQIEECITAPVADTTTKIEFTLTSLAGIRDIHKKELENLIELITEQETEGVLGIPVTEGTLKEKTVEIRTGGMVYTSISGEPKVRYDIVSSVEEEKICPPKSRPVTIEGHVKQKDADRFLAATKEDGTWGDVVETSKHIFKFPANSGRNPIKASELCRWDQAEERVARLMVLLKDEVQGVELVVAEYHNVTARATSDDVMLSPPLGGVVRGKLTKDGKPACPPEEWKDDKKLYGLFIDKIRGVVHVPEHEDPCY